MKSSFTEKGIDVCVCVCASHQGAKQDTEGEGNMLACLRATREEVPADSTSCRLQPTRHAARPQPELLREAFLESPGREWSSCCIPTAHAHPQWGDCGHVSCFLVFQLSTVSVLSYFLYSEPNRGRMGNGERLRLVGPFFCHL